MNYISFSLYGNNPIYVQGALRNAQDIHEKYKTYSSIFFVGDDIPADICKQLLSFGAHVKSHDSSWCSNGMFWRFYAFFLSDAEKVLIRDADSQILEREIQAVKEWEESNLEMHIMRDHPLHRTRIMGGMWGARAKSIQNLIDPKDFDGFQDRINVDQDFLSTHIYPFLFRKAMIHDSFQHIERNSRKFGVARIQGEYVGEVLDENGMIKYPKLRQDIIDIELSKFSRVKYRWDNWKSNIRQPIGMQSRLHHLFG